MALQRSVPRGILLLIHSACLLLAYCNLLCYTPATNSAQAQQETGRAERTGQTENTTKLSPMKPLRIATFNSAMNRKKAGELADDLAQGDSQAKKIAEIIAKVSPDILLLNELDYDQDTAKRFLDQFLNVTTDSTETNKTSSQPPWKYFYAGPVNTGVDSQLDLDANGKLHEPNDAWGFGTFPGQYGMAVFSRYPIDSSSIRTFQLLRWSDMPNALAPETEGKPYYPESIWKELRLSSKSHWDVPIDVHGHTVHILASHPTPPVFDGPEDRNGCRNHDEIRLFLDYISGSPAADYLVDDQLRRGGLQEDSYFAILGDLNADPVDGDGQPNAIRNLIAHPRIAKYPIPESTGAAEASSLSRGANLQHKGNPAYDTGDFNDKNPGNLRIDFVLPSANFKVLSQGVFWPSSAESKEDNELVKASDHRLVWVDVSW
jgi:endonuclease/exonuclease/phosphatase family metal-dependent hydrolase